MISSRLPVFVRGLTALVLVGLALTILIGILPVVLFPHDLVDASEGNRIAQAFEIASGRVAIRPPGDRGALYPFAWPVYSMLLTPLVTAFGPDIRLTRLLSYGLFVLAHLLLYRMARRRGLGASGSAACTATSVVLLAGGYHFSVLPYRGKEDYLALFLVMLTASLIDGKGAVSLSRFRAGAADLLLAVALGFLYLTKITVLPSLLACGLALIWCCGLRRTTSILAMSFAVVLILQAATIRFIGHGWNPTAFAMRQFILSYTEGPLRVLQDHVLMAPVLLLAGFALRRKRSWHDVHVLNAGLWCLAIYPMSIPMEAGFGYFAPAIPSLALLAAQAVYEVPRQHRIRALVFPLLLLLLPVLNHAPLPHVTSTDIHNGRRLQEIVSRDFGRPIIVDRHVTWCYQGGVRPEYDLSFVFLHMRLRDDSDRRLLADLESGRYPRILTSGYYETERVRAYLADHYEMADEITSDSTCGRFYRFRYLVRRPTSRSDSAPAVP